MDLKGELRFPFYALFFSLILAFQQSVIRSISRFGADNPCRWRPRNTQQQRRHGPNKLQHDERARSGIGNRSGVSTATVKLDACDVVT